MGGIEERSPYEEKVFKGLGGIIDSLKSNLGELNETISNTTMKLALSLTEASLVQKRMSFVREERATTQAGTLRARFTGPAMLNRRLAGFPGEVEFPKTKEELSIQQQAFTEFDSKTQDQIRQYSQGLGRVPRVVEYINSLDQQRRDVENQMADTLTSLETERRDRPWYDVIERGGGPFSDISKKAEDVIDSTAEKIKMITELRSAEQKSLEELLPVYVEFGKVQRAATELSSSMKTLRTALKEISIQEAVSDATKGYRDAIDELFGGGAPGAAVAISPEEERQAARVGIQLRHLQSDKYQVEEARIRYQLGRGELGPEQAMQARQRLRDLPEQRRRDYEARTQSEQNRRLREQTQPFVKQIEMLERVSRLPGVEAGTQADIQAVISDIAKSLSKVKEVTTREGKKYFEGVPIEDRERQSAAIGKIVGSLSEKMKGFDLPGFGSEISDPIVSELYKQTGLLSAIAESKALGKIDVSNIIETAQEEYGKNRLRGLLTAKAEGGSLVRGPGGPKGDKIPALLSDGEFVFQQPTVKKLGISTMNYINTTGKLPLVGFKDGGYVQADTMAEEEERIKRSLDNLRAERLNASRAGDLPAKLKAEKQIKTLHDRLSSLPLKYDAPEEQVVEAPKTTKKKSGFFGGMFEKARKFIGKGGGLEKTHKKVSSAYLKNFERKQELAVLAGELPPGWQNSPFGPGYRFPNPPSGEKFNKRDASHWKKVLELPPKDHDAWIRRANGGLMTSGIFSLKPGSKEYEDLGITAGRGIKQAKVMYDYAVMLKQSKSLKKDEKLDKYLKGAGSVLAYRSGGGDLTDRKFQDLLQRVQRQYREFHADVSGLRIKSEMAKAGFTDETKWRLASYDDPELYEKFKALGRDGYKGKKGYAGYSLLKKDERGSELEKILSGKDVFSDVASWFKGFKERKGFNKEEYKGDSWFKDVKDWLKKSVTDDIDTLHTGGIVGSTGPKFLEKGEVVLPKSYAEGGVVTSQIEKLSKKGGANFLNGKIELDSAEFKNAIASFESAVSRLDDIKLSVDSTPIPVDITGVSIPVDTAGITGLVVSVDASDAADRISAAITGSVVSVDASEAADRISAAIRTTTAGGTVGAERLDILAETVKAVDDRLINVKDSITTMVINATEQVQTVKSVTEQKVKELEEEVRKQASELRSGTADVVSLVSNISHRHDTEIRDLSYSVNKALSLTISNL